MQSFKKQIRDILREKRWSIPDEKRQEMSRRICSHLADEIGSHETVLVYCAKEPEVETCWFIDHLLERNINVVVPIIEKETIGLRLSYLRTRDDLCQGTFRVPEPLDNEIPADPLSITTAIIPMLGYDNKGGRIGYGAGYYDRFLSAYPHIRTIGLAYTDQELISIPVQDHDITMDLIVTEECIIRCNGGET